MNYWIKVVAVALPVTLGAGYWAVKGIDEPVVEVGKPKTTFIEPAPGIVNEVKAPGEPEMLGSVIRNSEPDATAPAVSKTPEARLIDLPSDLNQSDSSVASVMAELSPTLAQWLVPQEQIRKWVLAIDLLADGKLPQRHRPVSFSAPGFQVQPLIDEQTATTPGDERYLGANDNSQRFNALIASLDDIDVRTAGRYYKAWLPMLEQAYGELGKKDRFSDRVMKAVDNILAAQAIPAEGTLKQPHVLYEFESSALEQYSALDKAMWRLGDENRIAVQTFAKELRFYL